MATKDGSPPDSFPRFLSEHAEAPEQPGIGKTLNGKTWDGAISSRILRAGIVIVSAAAVDFAILSVGNPAAVFANVTTSLVDMSVLPAGTGRPTPTIQSTAGAPALPPTARDAPTRDEIAAALRTAYQTELRQPPAEALLKQFQAWATEQKTPDEIDAALEPGDRGETKIGQPSGEALLTQFQAWAAEGDARAQVALAEPVEDTRAQVVRNAHAEDRPIQKHRQARPVQNARAEIRLEQNPRAKVRPVQNAHEQDRAVQKTAWAPWPLQRIGWLN